MFAVIRTGGKQYKVKSGDTLHVEKLEGNPGDAVALELLLTEAGTPKSGGSVMATIVRQLRGEKIRIFKKRRRHNYRRRRGHRQYLTEVQIQEIKA